MIRRAQIEDLPGILLIEKSCFEKPLSEALLLREMRNPAAYYWILEEKGSVAAYGGFWQVADEAQIMNIGVLPAFRRKGMARKLLRTMKEEALKQGLFTLSLEVDADNSPARALYEKEGFIQVGERKNYYGEGKNAVLMDQKLER